MADGTLPEMGFFEKHADKIEYGAPSGCWLWSAGTNDWGYGQVRVGGRQRYAHREAFEAENGAGSAGGRVVRHRCDTPACVYPGHLKIGTQADNVRDRDERGRQAKGDANGLAKLTDDDIRMIRATYVRGCPINGQYALARRFGVHQTLIGMIVRREIWKHVL